MQSCKVTKYSAHWISTVDICLSESAKLKTAFVVSGMGKFDFNRVPFGLAQAPTYFQRLINEDFTDCNFAMGYLDDIIIFSKTEEEHLQHLEEIFKQLQKTGLKLNLQKCSFFKKHIQYPLTQLMKKNESFNWTNKCNKCFHMLKGYLQEAPILRYSDPSADYILYTDASKYTYVGVLMQTIDGTDHPVAYMCGLFRGSQLNQEALTKEAYAIYMSVKKLSFYLDSAQITLQSNYFPLKNFLEKNTMNSKVNNWTVK